MTSSVYCGYPASSCRVNGCPVDDCTATGFTVEGERIELCPDICAIVEDDPEGSLRSVVACFNEEDCGNGELDAGELCDDGNRIDGDGCDSECRTEGTII